MDVVAERGSQFVSHVWKAFAQTTEQPPVRLLVIIPQPSGHIERRTVTGGLGGSQRALLAPSQ